MELNKPIELNKENDSSAEVGHKKKRNNIGESGEGKEFILIKDDRTGTELQLISSTQSMEQLILSALTLKLNLLDDKKEVERSYIG